MYQDWLWYVKGLLRYWLTSCLAISRSNLIGCSGQTVLNLSNFSMFLIKHCLKIMCAKFRDDWTKFVIGYAFWRFWHKPRWRKIHHGANRRHRVRWTRLGSRNPMISCLWILDEWVKNYKHECLSYCDLLVALELMNLKFASWANGTVLNQCAKFRHFSPRLP